MSGDSGAPTRQQEHEIVIAVPAEDVWKALTDAEELARWFVEKASVTPGEGGTIWMSYGEGVTGESRIEVWEPGRRLRLVQQLEQPPLGAAQTRPEQPVVEDWLIETRGGASVLRLVQSGIPAASDWDGFYDSTKRGWESALRGLRHYLERHPGEQRRATLVTAQLAMPFEQAWALLTGPRGLAASGSLDQARPGGRYAVTTAGGERIEGEVLALRPPHTLALTVEPLRDGLLTVAFEDQGGPQVAWASLVTYGDDPMTAAHQRWADWLRGLFPAAS
jgi:uncharacterized protein YndB with AHSA1/START domain